jgi:hypothetical protein
LELNRDLDAAPIMSKARFMSRFEPSRPAVTVNLDRTADHAIREFLAFGLRAVRVLRGCYR